MGCAAHHPSESAASPFWRARWCSGRSRPSLPRGCDGISPRVSAKRGCKRAGRISRSFNSTKRSRKTPDRWKERRLPPVGRRELWCSRTARSRYGSWDGWTRPQSLEQGIALDPQPGVALQKLFELDVLRGRMKEAEAVLARAGVSRQEAVAFLIDHARAEVSRGSGGELPYLQAVVALDPTSEIGSVALVRALVRRGKTEEARAVLDRAERAGVDPLLVDAHRAWIAAREGKLDEARSWLGKVPPDRWKNDSRLSSTLTLIRASAPSLASP